MERETVIVLDFGGQYNQLIARRVRECNVYCEVHPYDLSLERIREMNPRGIIFTVRCRFRNMNDVWKKSQRKSVYADRKSNTDNMHKVGGRKNGKADSNC